MEAIEIGKLLRAGTAGFVVGCSVSQFNEPMFGSLVRAPVYDGYDVYGVIQDIHIDDDGLVRQLVTSTGQISEEVLRDNRERRIVPVEMTVVSVGYRRLGQICHSLPPQPPLSLDRIFQCSDEETNEFTNYGNYGYLRHILRGQNTPIGELVAAHLRLAAIAHGSQAEAWMGDAIRQLINELRDDYQALMDVLNSISEVLPSLNNGQEE